MNNEKMMKGAKALDRIVKIAGGIARAMVFVFLVFAVLVAAVGEKAFVPDSVTLDLEFITVRLAQEYQAITPMVRAYTAAILAAGAVYAFALFYLSRLVRGILAPMKEGRPFEKSVCVSLRRIAYWVFIVGGVSQMIGLVCSVMMVRAYPIDAVFSGSAVAGIEYAFTFDFGFAFAGFVILFLSWVFAYGQALQREADETL